MYYNLYFYKLVTSGTHTRAIIDVFPLFKNLETYNAITIWRNNIYINSRKITLKILSKKERMIDI